MNNSGKYNFRLPLLGWLIWAVLGGYAGLGLIKIIANVFWNYSIYGLAALAVMLPFSVIILLLLYINSSEVRFVKLDERGILISYFSIKKEDFIGLTDIASVQISTNKTEPDLISIKTLDKRDVKFLAFNMPPEDFIHYLTKNNIVVVVKEDS